MKRCVRALVACVLVVGLLTAGCDTSGVEGPAEQLSRVVAVPLPAGFPPLPVPPQNPLLADRVALGEALFFDPILSRDRSVSCASCHEVQHAFADPRRLSQGVGEREGLRNAPSLLNVAYRPYFFWDGGALFLESQALVPLEDEREMHLPLDSALARLAAHPHYRARFAAAFDGQGPTMQTLTYALAAYERTLVSAPTAFDRYRTGEEHALPPAARRGLRLFETHCTACHAGPMLTTDGFENNGVAVTDDDPGREHVTTSPADRGFFRVPSLRGVARTAPYFHDGRFATLDDVVAHYDRGGTGTAGQSPRVQPLHLSPARRADLVAFLKTLDDLAVAVDRSDR